MTDKKISQKDQELWDEFCDSLDDDAPILNEGQESFAQLLEEIEQRPVVNLKKKPLKPEEKKVDDEVKPALPAIKKKKPLPVIKSKEIDANTKKRLRRGKLQIDGILDLHGHDRYQAYDRLVSFIQMSQTRGSRVVLVITGKGLLSKDGVGVIKSKLPEWLHDAPLSDIILDYTLARGKDGGGGAYYLLLRKKK